MAAMYDPELDPQTLRPRPNDEDVVDTDIIKASLALKDAATIFAGHTRATLAVAEAFVHKTVKESPYLALGSAAAGGFVVGGGLGAPLTRKMLGFGLRAGQGFVLDAALRAFGLKAPAASAAASAAAAASEPVSRRATSSEDEDRDTSIDNGDLT